jgi:hypothetical protein
MRRLDKTTRPLPVCLGTVCLVAFVATACASGSTATQSRLATSPAKGAAATSRLSTPAPASSAGQRFRFAGMTFTVAGEVDYMPNPPQCPRSLPAFPTGTRAIVSVVPNYSVNCPALTATQKQAKYPLGYLGQVDLYGKVELNSIVIRIAKQYATSEPALPAGSFQAEIPADAAAAFMQPTGPTRDTPVFLFWNHEDGAAIEVSGAHAAILAGEIQHSLTSS